MPDSNREAVNCEQARAAMAEARALTASETAHLRACDNCLEVWLDAAVMRTLEAKPEVRIPADFAAQVAARLPQDGVASGRGEIGVWDGHWGLLTAGLLVATGLTVAAFADPAGVNTRMGLIFVSLIASEVAGIGLWLGVDWSNKHQN